MEQSPWSLVFVGVVWVISLTAGVTLIYRALADYRRSAGSAGHSWARRAGSELRFRLRLAAGAGLIVWVILGLIWLATNWD